MLNIPNINITSDDIQVFDIQKPGYQHGREVKIIVVKTEMLSNVEYVTKLLRFVDPEFDSTQNGMEIIKPVELRKILGL